MARPSRYSPEVRERAGRMVFEHEAEHASQWSTIRSIAGKMGCSAETLRNWVRQAERDSGRRAGLTTSERQRLKELERDNRDLRRANEILRKASALFAKAELDRRPKQWCASSMTTRAPTGIEPICKMLPIAPSTHYMHAARGRTLRFGRRVRSGTRSFVSSSSLCGRT